VQICPSILSADFANLESELASISAADMIHVDVMDGHFVPNLTFGLPVVRRLSEVTELGLDVHLMIEDVDNWAPRYAEVAKSVTFHLEASRSPAETAAAIRAQGSLAAIAIKPATDLSMVVGLLGEIDMLLIMTVEPGFGGQPLIEATLEKISAARNLIATSALKLKLQVDGGVTAQNIAQLAELGADVFVAGSAVFGSGNRNQRIHELRSLASLAE
jgi:ribulose-phosphate 3-epimerase